MSTIGETAVQAAQAASDEIDRLEARIKELNDLLDTCSADKEAQIAALNAEIVKLQAEINGLTLRLETCTAELAECQNSKPPVEPPVEPPEPDPNWETIWKHTNDKPFNYAYRYGGNSEPPYCASLVKFNGEDAIRCALDCETYPVMHRTEVRLNQDNIERFMTYGRTYRFTWRAHLSADFVSTCGGSRCNHVWAQIHNVVDRGVPVAINLGRGDGIGSKLCIKSDAGPTVVLDDAKNYAGKETKFVIEFKPTLDNTGHLKVWVNDRLEVDYQNVQTVKTDTPNEPGPHWGAGHYLWVRTPEDVASIQTKKMETHILGLHIEKLRV